MPLVVEKPVPALLRNWSRLCWTVWRDVRSNCFLRGDVEVFQEFIKLHCWDLEQGEGERSVKMLSGRKGEIYIVFKEEVSLQ